MCKYIAYTDGSYQASLNAGGYGAIILDENQNVIKEIYQGFKNTTNNRMEIMGVLEVLKYFKDPVSIKIISDSKYVIDTINNGYLFKWIEEQDYSKKNLDLWFQLADYVSFHKAEFEWTKGHSNNKYNNLADELSVHAAQCLNLKEDIWMLDSNYSKLGTTGIQT